MSTPQSAALDRPPSRKSQGQLITRREGIARLLRKLQAQHSPIKLSFTSVAEEYTSLILSVDEQEGYLLMDEVVPRWGDNLMSKGVSFRFHGFYDGCRVSSSRVTALGRSLKDGTPLYKVPFPDELLYLQRRQFFRASVRSTLDIRVRLGIILPPEVRDEFDNVIIQEPTWQYEGQLKDLSAQGCQVELKGNLLELIPLGKRFEGCRLIFPNGQHLESNLIVRRVQVNEEQDTTRLGCQFTEVNAGLEQQISFVVTELQRDNNRDLTDPTTASALFTPASETTDAAGTTADTATSAEIPKKKNKHLDVSALHQQSVIAVKTLVEELRKQQPLSIKPVWRCAKLLLQALIKHRDELLLLTRIRSAENYLYEHSVSVGVLLADQTHHDRKNPRADDPVYLTDLIFAGLCHDIGKGLIPESIMGKQDGLTEQEAKVMHKHSLLTREILSRQPGTPEVALLVATQNCERLDGSGFPEKLKGFAISQVGKLAAVIDVFDAMTTTRSYRKALPHALAYKRLLGMQEQLDLELVRNLIKNQGIFPVGSLLALNDGHLAFVKTLNAQRQPELITLVYNKTTQNQLTPEDMNLSQHPELEIRGPEDPAKYGLSNQALMTHPLPVAGKKLGN